RRWPRRSADRARPGRPPAGAGRSALARLRAAPPVASAAMKIGQVLGKVFKGAAKALQDKDERPRRRSRGRKRSQPSPEAPRRADGPRFEYSPDLDGAPDPGEVVWAWVPYEDDPNQGQDRPVLLIGRHGSEL